MTSAYAVIFVVAFFGNTLGLFVVFKKTSRSTSVANLFIANMAAADHLLLTVTAMPYSVAYFYRGAIWFRGTLGIITCKAVHYAILVSIAATVLAMVLISFDRFYAVFYPLRGKLFRKPRILSAVIWILSFILMIPAVLYYQVKFLPSQNAHICVWDWPSDHVGKIFHISLFVKLYMFPLVIMAILYVLICVKLWRRKIPGNASGRSRAVEMSKRKVLRLLVVIVVVFALCWFPTYVSHYFIFVRPEHRHKLPSTVQFVSFWLAHANSAIYPCLYILLNYSFRKRLVSTLARCPCLRCFSYKAN
ncbi:neuromedin-K receptor-like [Oculina patagonica]